ncbi:DNA repair protein RecO [Telmatospirillum siberiense]|uniref:DNA repair protein RecO n=1 Tax=Telmatospirillum siberiense TaxID=382514 RepID=A0A2N3PYV9_9PROT|nr:DNA repair protein RecO [Telmatospirillum siberiense]PKU25541.1 DNA repair protein RecO [Telmatospirillum siberiense]
MDWTDEGILLSLRRHGETGAVATLLTRKHGRHAGLIHGGAGKAARAALQTGNRLQVTWAARLSEQLGRFSWELAGASGSVWLHDPLRLAGVSAACALSDLCLPEREPHRAVYEGLAAVIEGLAGQDWPSLYVRWELGLLAELGYSLDLTSCAASGATEDLVYVSPRSGRAVSRAAGQVYHARLLPLPGFLLDDSSGDRQAVIDGLSLTGYFLERHVLAPQGRGLPPARSRLVDRLLA